MPINLARAAMAAASPSAISLRRYEADELSAEQAAAIYFRDQLLWLRLPAESRECCSRFTLGTLAQQYAARPKLIAKNWSVENNPDHLSESCLEPGSVLGTAAKAKSKAKSEAKSEAKSKGGGPAADARWYVSTILQKDKAGQAAFLERMPVVDHPLMVDAETDDGIWLFVGSNPPLGRADEAEGSGRSEDGKPKAKKRRRSDREQEQEGEGEKQQGEPLAGRPEHVDDVTHDGTWHVQVSGTKTW